jgi:2-polyprenyl-6-methoxyphenol hydroxylase-like FAD-dependent oxidoreductase
MRSSFDAVIVGARSAGTGTALHLARHGWSVLVVEQAPSPAAAVATQVLLRAGVLQLSRWGLLEGVYAAGTPPVTRTTYHLGGDDLAITVKPAAGVDAFCAPPRSVLETVLNDAARAAGAEVRVGTRAIAVHRDGGRVSGVDLIDRAGRRASVDTRIVIGADGRHSTIAAAVGAPLERVATASSSITYGYASGVALDGYRWWFRGRRTVGAIPTAGGEACIFTGGPSRDHAQVSPEDVLRQGLRRTAPELAELIGPVRSVRTARGSPGYLRRPWGPGWALVGTAGYREDPITAHGTSEALRDAELLARAVVAGAGVARWQDEALQGFHAERDRLSVPLFDVAEELARHAWTDDSIRELLLRNSSAQVDEVEALLGLERAGGWRPVRA